MKGQYFYLKNNRVGECLYRITDSGKTEYGYKCERLLQKINIRSKWEKCSYINPFYVTIAELNGGGPSDTIVRLLTKKEVLKEFWIDLL